MPGEPVFAKPEVNQALRKGRCPAKTGSIENVGIAARFLRKAMGMGFGFGRRPAIPGVRSSKTVCLLFANRRSALRKGHKRKSRRLKNAGFLTVF